jgi:hypothetical protein
MQSILPHNLSSVSNISSIMIRGNRSHPPAILIPHPDPLPEGEGVLGGGCERLRLESQIMNDISNEELTLDLVPHPDADWEQDISPFALTFYGYGYCENSNEFWCGAKKQFLEDGTLPEDLSALRSLLFIEQRDWWWSKRSFSGNKSDLSFARELTRAIREVVQNRTGLKSFISRLTASVQTNHPARSQWLGPCQR